MSTVIRVENLSKHYKLGSINHGVLFRDIQSAWARFRGKPDPNIRLDQQQRASDDRKNFWALQDVSFDVKQGEVLGIIGRNGAGKSTLLKILSRVTSPTRGQIKVRGRIASLLEVGTGFHPELTGRENIYLNGAILGMSKSEIRRNLDQIVDFANLHLFIDTPVKRYSSGMYVRLGFAVAAHLESEVLIVDEVLAVGDVEFQKKCLGKMEEISLRQGRTVLFVSHNMGAVQNLCSSAVLLRDGKLSAGGSTHQVISEYMLSRQEEKAVLDSKRSGTGEAKFTAFWVEDTTGKRLKTIVTGQDVVFVFQIAISKPIKKLDLGFSIHNIFGDGISVLYSSYQGKVYDFPSVHEPQPIEIRVRLDSFAICLPQIQVRGRLVANMVEIDWPEEALGIVEIEAGNYLNTGDSMNFGTTTILMRGKWQ